MTSRPLRLAAGTAFAVVLIVAAVLGVQTVMGDDDPTSTGVDASTPAASAAPSPRASVTPSDRQTLEVPEGYEDKFFDSIEEQRAAVQAVQDRYPSVPATSESFGPLTQASYESSGAYAVDFTQQLFGVDFANDSWTDLMSWVRWEVAPPRPTEEMPITEEELTAEILHKVIYPPLSDGLRLVPDEQEWSRLASAGATQAVRNTLVAPDPVWAQLEAEGKTPEQVSGDPLSECVQVSATIDRTTGVGTTSRDVMFRMCVGTAVSHPGLGFAGIGLVRELS